MQRFDNTIAEQAKNLALKSIRVTGLAIVGYLIMDLFMSPPLPYNYGEGDTVGTLPKIGYPPQGIPIDIPTDLVIPKDEDEPTKYVTIYRAPQNLQNANKELTHGYNILDFPRSVGSIYPDGAVYFAPPDCRKVAEHWNKYYQSGIIEITMPETIYNTIFRPQIKIDGFSFGEYPYPSPSLDMGLNPKEVRIPHEYFDVLNKFPRLLKPF